MKPQINSALFSFGLLLIQSLPSISPNNAFASEDKPSAHSEPYSVNNEVFKLKITYHAKIIALLKSKNYDGLEQAWLKVDSDQQPLPNGKAKVDYFVASFLVDDRAHEIKPVESDFASVITMLTNWCNAKPKSSYARVALAIAYDDYGWYARGGGFAGTVSDSGWKLMADRQLIASRLLDEAKKLQAEKYSAFILRLKIAKDSSVSKAVYDHLVDETVAKYPGSKTPYFLKVLDLQPRWGGEAGEWERFIQTSADKIGGINGDKFYAQCVWAVDKTHWYDKENIFRSFKLDYARIKRGFVALQSSSPDSFQLLSEYCHIASLDGDKETAKKLFAALNWRVDYDAWWDEETFNYWRNFSMS